MAYATTEAKKELDTLINKVNRKKQRVALTRQGKPVAAVVSIKDLEYLEAMEAQEDAEDIKACKAALKRGKSDLIPWDNIKKDLGYV